MKRKNEETRYIDATAFKERMRQNSERALELACILGKLTREKEKAADATLTGFLQDIDEEPTADVVKRTYGTWKLVSMGDSNSTIKCSECGRETESPHTNTRYEYCPHCGAKMG